VIAAARFSAAIVANGLKLMSAIIIESEGSLSSMFTVWTFLVTRGDQP
jgi:hypothetical protein